MAMNKYLQIITLNVNDLNALIRRHRVAEWIREHDLCICCLQRHTSKQKIHTAWKWGDEKKTFQANGSEKKAGVAILISDKIDFKIKP